MSDFQITNSYIYKKIRNTVWEKFKKQNHVYLFFWYSTTKLSQVKSIFI